MCNDVWLKNLFKWYLLLKLLVFKLYSHYMQTSSQSRIWISGGIIQVSLPFIWQQSCAALQLPMTFNLLFTIVSEILGINVHRRTGRCGALAIATWAAWFLASQGRLLTKKKEERKGQKGRFNIFATAGLRTQSAPVNVPFSKLFLFTSILVCVCDE